MEYEILSSVRARILRITVHADGRVVVTKPARMAEERAVRYVEQKRAWIKDMQEKLALQRERSEKRHGVGIPLPRLRRGTAPYRAAQTQARALATERVAHFAALGHFSYASISIRNQKTRWGSCSVRNNLSFNYRLIYLPPDILDYLIVHELAHTKHHNHSQKFWDEVGKYIPEYAHKRRELKRYRW